MTRRVPGTWSLASSTETTAAGSLHEVLSQSRGYQCDFDREPPNTCVPEQFGIVNTTFADAACTEPLVAVLGPRPPLAMRAAAFCGAETEYYDVGDEFTESTVYSNRTGSCVSQSVGGPVTYYRVGESVLPSELGEATTAREGEGALLAARRVDADGEPLGLPYRFWNTAIDRECFPAAIADSIRCVPNDGIPTNGLWADATCSSTQLAEVPRCATPGSLVYDRGPALNPDREL